MSLAPATPTASGRPSLHLDARTEAQAMSCVHCGLCLPACPTYLQTGHEGESPRGRIDLMRGLSNGIIAPTQSVRAHLDSCLDCRGCETACPSGVKYHELIEETRTRLHARGLAPLQRIDPLSRWFLMSVLIHPRRLKLAMLPARLLQRIRLYNSVRRLRIFEMLPPELQAMEKLLPDHGALWPRRMPERISAGGVGAMLAALYKTAVLGRSGITRDGRPKRTVAGFLTGCVGSVLGNDVNRKSVDLIASCGIDIFAPRRQQCCGAIHQHNGEMQSAQKLARQNIDLFLPVNGRQVDYIISNISGCGATLREYGSILRDDPKYAERAEEFSRRVRDIHEILAQFELPPFSYPVKVTGTYHEACHLVHAQKVTEAPKKLLGRIQGLQLLPLTEADLCCGAAGTYNLTQPKMAGDLAERKLRNIEETQADICIAANIGCAMHLQAAAKSRGRPIRVVHPVELIHQAVFGNDR
jgi:glycolate oxidase iron-sulfur subunit